MFAELNRTFTVPADVFDATAATFPSSSEAFDGGVADVASADLAPGEDAELTELGNAQVFARDYRHEIRYCESRDVWYSWNGTYWQRGSEAIAAEKMKRVVLNFQRLAEHMRAAVLEKDADVVAAAQAKFDKRGELKANQQLSQTETAIRSHLERAERLRKHSIAHQTAAKIYGAVRLAQSDPQLSIKAEAFDSDSLVLNLQNGAYDLKTKTFREHRKSDYCSRIAAVAYDPAATCPSFQAFLDYVLPDRDVQEFIQKAFGTALTGEQLAKFFIFVGEGRNGKTTLTEIMGLLLGLDKHTGYAASVSFNTFCVAKTGTAAPRPDLVKLNGVRFASMSEANEDSLLDIALIKEWTGNEYATVRTLFKEDESFKPQATFFAKTNKRPRVNDDTDGAWSRIAVVPFEVRVPDDKQDPHFGEKLAAAEASGILNWLIDGWKKYSGLVAEHRDPLALPARVKAATFEYKQAETPVLRFVDEVCELDKDAFTKNAALYDAYTAWCSRAREKADSREKFSRAVLKHFKSVAPHRNTTDRGLKGIRLRGTGETDATGSDGDAF